MNDERMQSVLEEWFKARDAAPDDVRRSARHVAERRPQVRQRSRWWPFPVFYRKAQAPTTDTADYLPTSIPAINGHAPTVLGRTQSMFSPVKAITAGALVFALGGVLLIAQPFDQQGGGVPGAATDADIVPPVEVTGRLVQDDGCSGTEYEGPFEDSGAHAALYTCSTDTGSRWSFSDPRLEGTGTRIVEEVTFELGDVSDVYIASNAFSIENDGGTWRERPRTWLMPDGIATFDWLPQEVLVLEGSGDYEGLVAVLRLTGGQRGVGRGGAFRGFIVDARWMPPPPENALTE